MRIYRLYFLDRDNDVVRVKELTCDDDAAAVALAETEIDQPKVRRELWQSANLVRAWEGQGER